ncbi:EI24 domain-containing protein [Okibacterium endophyticum]
MRTHAQSPERRSVVRGFFSGIAMLARGFRMWGTSPKLMLLGAIPALITVLLYTALVVVLLVNQGDLVTWLTPFADDWVDGWRVVFRIAVGLALLGLGVLLLISTYTAVTMIIGQPFFEAISHEAERQFGGVPDEVDVGFWRAAGRGILEALRMLLVTAAIGVGLFLVGFVPVVGTVVSAVIGAFVGGWFLALELTTVSFERRGLRLRDRRRALGAHRATALGFGVATFVLFLIPGGALLVMPAAVAGGALVARKALHEPLEAGER